MFSGKKKKEQLQAKREKKRQAAAHLHEAEEKSVYVDNVVMEEQEMVEKVGQSHEGEQGGVRPGEYKYGADRRGIRSVFKKESDHELEARKKLNYAPLRHRRMMPAAGIPPAGWLTVPTDSASSWSSTPGPKTISFPLSCALPHRGWQEGAETTEEEDDQGTRIGAGSLSAGEINAIEKDAFEAYIQRVDAYKVEDVMEGVGKPVINVYERNLDVWRQLWRTVEASDVVLLVTDVRFPILHLPLSLLRYIIVEEQKPCIIVLNKVDMVPPSTLQGWCTFLPAYLESVGLVRATPPLPPVRIKTFTANPVLSTNANAGLPSLAGEPRGMTRRKKEKKRAHLYEALRSGKLPAKAKPHPGAPRGRRDSSGSESDNDQQEEEEEEEEEDGYHSTTNFKGMKKATAALQSGRQDFHALKTVSAMISDLLQECRQLGDAARRPARIPKDDDDDDVGVRIGVVGHPNVGKSSLLNCIRGTKVVSVSSTAGRTKHLQTIPIPDEGVTLLDSPGIVFPVFGIPRQLQSIIGTHQVAQTRDPQSSVAYLAMHLPLENIFGLRRPEGSCAEDEWCAFDFCEAYATKRGFFVKHGKGALDIHRASLTIIQEAYDGRIPLYFAPPDLEYLASRHFCEIVKPNLLLPFSTLSEK